MSFLSFRLPPSRALLSTERGRGWGAKRRLIKEEGDGRERVQLQLARKHAPNTPQICESNRRRRDGVREAGECMREGRRKGGQEGGKGTKRLDERGGRLNGDAEGTVQAQALIFYRGSDM